MTTRTRKRNLDTTTYLVVDGSEVVARVKGPVRAVGFAHGYGRGKVYVESRYQPRKAKRGGA